MTNKLVVIINYFKVPKIKKVLLYEMIFLVPNYRCLQIRGLRPPDARSPCPLSSTVFVELPPEQNSWVCHWSTGWSNTVHLYSQYTLWHVSVCDTTAIFRPDNTTDQKDGHYKVSLTDVGVT